MIKTIYRNILFISLLICVSGYVSAQKVSFTVVAPNVVEVNEVFQIQYVSNAEPEQGFQIQNIKGLELLGGPQRGQSTQISIVNGRRSMEYKITETYSYRALNPGSVTIPQAKIHVDGRPYRTRPKTIEVVGSASAKQQYSQSQQQSSQGTQQSANQSQQTYDDIFVRVNVNKTNAYVGEAIYVSLKLYTKYRINLNEHSYPDFPGFFKKDIEAPQNLQYTSEIINGKEYNTVLFKKMVVFPQRSGQLKITPFEIDCNILIPHSRGFWGMQYNEKRKIVASDPIVISGKPLPSPKPSHFKGAVGQFTVSGKTDVVEIPQNEAFSYTVVVRGRGNMSLFQPPNITFPPDFEVYEPKVSHSVTPTAHGERGKVTYKYVIIPRHKGNFEIPRMQFSYFNPETQSYELSVVDKIPVVVTQGTESSPQMVSNYSQHSKEEVTYFGNDIRFIKTNPSSLKKKRTYILSSPLYALWYVIPLLILISLLIFRRKKIAENKNIAKVRTKKANRESKKRLKQAASLLREGKDSAYYQSVAQALLGYISDKYTISRVDLNKDVMSHFLSQKSVPEEYISELIDVLEVSEFGQYTPNPSIQDKEKLYVRASELIRKFEQIVK